MASRSNRQRRLERARTERRVARRAEHVRRRRQVQAGIGGALVLILLVLGTTWLLGGFDSKPAEIELASCTWTPKEVIPGSGVTATGLPPTSGEPRTGVQLLRIQTAQGEIQAVIDVSRVPCAAASMKHLGSVGYYDGSVCSFLDTARQTLTCGDRTGNGSGSPEYQFPVEGKPTEPVGTAAAAPPGVSPSPSESASVVPSYYAKGTIVLNTLDQNANGGQFSIVYVDGSNLPPEYTPVGTITQGLEIVEAVAAAGALDANSAPAVTGKPATELKIDKLLVQDELSVDPTGTPTPEPTPSASATPSPGATS